MKQVYLLGYPVGHSLSPAMHNAAFEALELPARYDALEVAPDDLSQAVAQLRDADCYGANVTIPHKVAIMPLLDALSETARRVGAVNTVVNQQGRLLGDNTDAEGFLRALKDQGFGPTAGQRTLVLGAGGAARAIVYALLSVGASVELYNRTHEKAVRLARDFAYLGEVHVLDFAALANAVRATTLLVNTTSIGMAHEGQVSQASPLAPGLLPHKAAVVDIIYRPAQTQLLKDAKAAGLVSQNGLGMLVYQGAASFEAWTGYKAPSSLMMQAAQSALGQPQAQAYPHTLFKEGQA